MGKVADPDATFPLLLDGGRKYDVILLASGLHWDGLPEKMRQLLLDRVREGTGLVYIRGFGWAKKFDAVSKEPPSDPTLESALWRTLPGQCVPANARWRKPIEKLVRFADLGKGRVVQCLWNVWVGYKPYKAEGLVPHPIEETDIPTFRYWEYAHAAVAKMLYYAAGRDPDVRILSISRATEAGPSLGKATLALKARKGADLVAEIGVYDRFHRELALIKRPVTVKPGPWRLSIDLPAVEDDGEHPVEVRLLRDGKVVDWAALVVPVQTRFSIAAAAFSKKLYAPREAPVLCLGLRNASDADQRAEVRVRVVDSWRRCVRMHAASVQVPPTIGDRTYAQELTLPSFVPLTPYHRAEIKLVVGERVCSERDVPFSVALPLPFDYNFLCWSGYAISSHYTDQRHVQLVRSIGYDIYSMNQHGENYQPYSMPAFEKGYEAVTRAGLRPLAQSVSPVRTHWRSKEPPKIRPEPLCSEEYREKAARYIERSCVAAERFYLHALSSGDEPSLGWYDRAQDFDHSPLTLERFREHLKKTYEVLDRFNAIWKKDFKSWDEVVPDTFAQARARKHFASWADHRLYMEIELTDFLRFFAHEVETASGGVPMALSGMGFGGVFNGFDFSRLMPLLDRSTLYGDGDGEFAKPEIQRSFQRKGALNGVWIGYGNTEEFLRAWIWLQALSDKFLVSVYSSTYQVRCERYLTERGRFYQRLFKEYRESGTGTLLRSADRVEDPIAILYSKPSIMAAAVTGLTDRRYSVLALRHNRDAWTRVVHDTGFNCRFVSNWQVADGILSRDGYRVLVLPLTQSVSRAEAEKIAQFVRDGGLLIADVRSAVLDEHCVPYDRSPLDEVLGLDRTQAGPAPGGNAIEVIGSRFCRASKFRGTTLERNLRLEGATALGRGVLAMKGRDGTYGTLKVESTRDVSRSVAEALFLHRHGKGAAVYCNFMLDNYRDKLSNGTAHEVYRVFADLIRNVSSLKPRAEVLSDGELLTDCHTVCYRNGATHLVALQRHTYSYRYPRLTEDRREPVTVRLPATGHVYEVWTRGLLGTGSQVEDVLEPGARRLYVVLPYKATAMGLRGPASVAPGSDLTLEAQIATDGAPAQAHVFRVTVTRPDGQETEHHAQNLVAPGGRTSLVLPIALDAPTGRWTAQVRDVLSGATATRPFQVSRRKP